MKNIIIDTDPGHDDALALMLAIKSGIFNILAITTVAGNSDIKNTTRNAQYIMGLLNSKIPVYSGSDKPINRELIKAVVHGDSGLAGLDPEIEPILSENAVEKIIDIVKSTEDVTIITLGPLTNIARAIQKDPETMTKVEEIVIMGGAINVPGNKNRVAEFNIFVDPEAADIVFQSTINKTLIPLDACNHVQLQLNDFDKLKDSSLYEPIISMMKPYIENIFKEEGIKAALMYDPLTVYHLINPEACKTKKYDIKVETKGELTRGMTVVELRNIPKNENITVVENIDADSFKRDFINILRS